MKTHVAVIGAGPAGLMAAEAAIATGAQVDVFDAMPSAGRKFLLAGKGGMNITHSEALDTFLTRYGERRQELTPVIRSFDPDALRAWISDLGIDTFVGTSGRVFPKEMKAAPLLRAWLHRLRSSNVRFHMRHRWLGWNESGGLRFETPEDEFVVDSGATVLALGGASWPKLGSDGAWLPVLAQHGVDMAQLKPSNCGFNVEWSAHFRERFAGQPLKSIAGAVDCGDGGPPEWRRGEALIKGEGIEGGLIYALSAGLRNAIERNGTVTLLLDLAPEKSMERLKEEISHPRGSRSLSSHLQSRAGIQGVKMGLLREVLSKEEFSDPTRLAAAVKSVRVKLVSPRPIEEAISSAGGIRFAAINDKLMLKCLPGVFCAGEMLDWEAPTGGYLLTACFASGRVAGRSAAEWTQDSIDKIQEQ
jgi:uncharacterized flavoprotein (TIGR03862 family)